MTDNQPTPKQVLTTLINSALAAAKSGDALLQQFAAQQLSAYIENIEINLPEADEQEDAE